MEAQVEALCYLQCWSEAEQIVQIAASRQEEASTSLFESLCNVIWTARGVPEAVTISVLEVRSIRLPHSSTRNWRLTKLSSGPIARWTRL